MNTSTKSLLIRLSILALILIVALLRMNTAIESAADPAASIVDGSYRPQDHGLPEIIAGYRILGVITPENTACTPTGTKRVVLQVAEPTVEDFLNSSPNLDAVHFELERIDANIQWEIAIVGPTATAEQIARGNPEWNAAFGGGNCIRLGEGLRLALTPHPTP